MSEVQLGPDGISGRGAGSGQDCLPPRPDSADQIS